MLERTFRASLVLTTFSVQDTGTFWEMGKYQPQLIHPEIWSTAVTWIGHHDQVCQRQTINTCPLAHVYGFRRDLSLPATPFLWRDRSTGQWTGLTSGRLEAALGQVSTRSATVTYLLRNGLHRLDQDVQKWLLIPGAPLETSKRSLIVRGWRIASPMRHPKSLVTFGILTYTHFSDKCSHIDLPTSSHFLVLPDIFTSGLKFSEVLKIWLLFGSISWASLSLPEFS